MAPTKNKNKVLSDIEDDLFSLIGQIDYGEISHIDTYWRSLSDSLLKLKIKNWDTSSSEECSTVSEILVSLSKANPDLVTQELIDLICEMEDASEASSTDSVDEENLDILQSSAIDLEELFTKFIDQFKE
jgi:hypothetical protein